MSGHEHTRRCYWDFYECRWVCRPARAEDDPAYAASAEFPATEVRVAAARRAPEPAVAT